jgi:hypothetical protein
MATIFNLPFADVGSGIKPSDGAKLFFYETGTDTLKDTFTTSVGNVANSNPVIALATGVFPLIYLTGAYWVALKDKNDVQIWAGVPVESSGNEIVSTLTELAAISPELKAVYLSLGGRSGMFAWNGSNLATEVTADTAQGNYVAPTSDITGANGAWVRAITATIADQLGGTYLSYLSKLRCGQEQFVLSSAISQSDYDAVREKTNTDDHSAVLSNVLEDAKDLFVPEGLWLIGDINPTYKVNGSIKGANGRSYSFEQNEGATILRRHPAKTNMFLSLPNFTFENIEMDGDLEGTGTSGDLVRASSGSEIYIKSSKLFNAVNGFVGDSSEYNALYTYDSVYRGHSSSGIRNIKDSFIWGSCYFAGNRSSAIYANGGQIDIGNSFFEFAQDGAGGIIPAILLDRNSNEVKIHSNTFDRNSGNDIRILSSGSDHPTDIQIMSNIFKGSAWAETNMDQAVSIFCNGEAEVTLGGNKFQRRSSTPSLVLGNISPVSCYNLEAAKKVVDLGNDAGNVSPVLTLGGEFNLSWVQSVANTNEYYLVSSHPAANSKPLFINTDFIRDDTQNVQLVAGTVGSLTANQYAFNADNDTLGFTTTYVRLDGTNPNSNDVIGIYQDYPFKGPTDSLDTWSTTQFQDIWKFNIAAAATSVGQLSSDAIANTSALAGSFSRGFGTIRIFGDQASTTSDGFFDVHFTLDRGGSSSTITVNQGSIDTNEAGFTVGWAGAGTDIELALTVSRLATLLTLSVENTSANGIDLVVQLLR